MPDTQQAFSAVKKADETITLLIQHQPELFNSNRSSGMQLGAFISELRQALTDMYNLTPPL